MEDEGNVLKYMTKCEMGKQRSCLLIMTQRLFVKERMLVLAMAYIIIAFSYYSYSCICWILRFSPSNLARLTALPLKSRW